MTDAFSRVTDTVGSRITRIESRFLQFRRLIHGVHKDSQSICEKASWKDDFSLGPPEHYGRGFESLWMCACIPALFCVVLFCVGTGLSVGRSPSKESYNICKNS